MPSNGGDILEVAFAHPTLGGGTLFPKSNEDNTFDLGGFRTNDDANQVTGSGDMIRQLNRVRWGFECTLANDMNTRTDLEKLNSLAGSSVDATWTISHKNGAVYKGVGTVVGDVQANQNTATIKFKVAGSGNLKKIAG